MKLRYVRTDGGSRWHLSAGKTGFGRLGLSYPVAEEIAVCGQSIMPPVGRSSDPPEALICKRCQKRAKGGAA